MLCCHYWRIKIFVTTTVWHIGILVALTGEPQIKPKRMEHGLVTININFRPCVLPYKLTHIRASHATHRPDDFSAENRSLIHTLTWRHRILGHDTIAILWVKIGKGSHTRLPTVHVGFRSWSRFLAVSLQMTWVINPAVGCHYFPPGLQLPSWPLRGLMPISLLGEQRHNGCKQFA